MANRPGTLCQMTAGQSIYNQSNFVDTFNWVVQSMNNLKGGNGIKVDWTASDTPEISMSDPNPPPPNNPLGGPVSADAGVNTLNTLSGDVNLSAGYYTNLSVTVDEDTNTIRLDVYYI